MSRLYIRVMTGFYSHRKTVRLRLKIGTDAFWIPPRLWAYAAEHQPDGNLSGYSSEEISDLIYYKGNAKCNAKDMLQALKDCGFIDESGVIHDWHEHNGYHEKFSKRAKLAAAARWSKKPLETEIGKGKVESGDKHCLEDATSTERPLAHFPEIQIPTWEEVQAQCEIIGLAEWRARDWFDEMKQSGWKDNKGREVMHWQSFLNRVKTWWERDGRQMNPPAGKNRAERPQTAMDLKTIIAAKETKCAALRKKHCSDTAIDSVWNDPAKRAEFFKVKKEIKDLNEQLSNMA